MQETEIPADIQHLDFDPDVKDDTVTETKEKPEKDKTCDVLLPHPQNKSDMGRCGRSATYKIVLHLNTCGHKINVYMCKTCWDVYGPMNSKHTAGWTHGGSCQTDFDFKSSIISFETIK